MSSTLLRHCQIYFADLQFKVDQSALAELAMFMCGMMANCAQTGLQWPINLERLYYDTDLFKFIWGNIINLSSQLLKKLQKHEDDLISYPLIGGAFIASSLLADCPACHGSCPYPSTPAGSPGINAHCTYHSSPLPPLAGASPAICFRPFFFAFRILGFKTQNFVQNFTQNFTQKKVLKTHLTQKKIVKNAFHPEFSSL